MVHSRAADGVDFEPWMLQTGGELWRRHLAVLLCGMEAPPNAGPAYATAFREAFSSVARDERIPFVRFVLDKVAGIEGLNQDDGIHPNVRGARIVADTVWPALQPLLTAASRS
jgi:acyl-CoA thioesterase-1